MTEEVPKAEAEIEEDILTQEQIDLMTDDDVAFELDQAPDDERLLKKAIEFAAAMSDDDLLNVDLFSDDAESRVLDNRIVRGRKPHTDHYSRRSIAVGARHRMQREMCEGEFLVTRHSELSLFMVFHGFDMSEAAAA